MITVFWTEYIHDSSLDQFSLWEKTKNSLVFVSCTWYWPQENNSSNIAIAGKIYVYVSFYVFSDDFMKLLRNKRVEWEQSKKM